MSRITSCLLAATALTGWIGLAQAQNLPPQSPASTSNTAAPRSAGTAPDTAATPTPPRPPVPALAGASSAASPVGAARRGGTGGPLQLAGDMAGIIEMVPHIVCLAAPDARPPALPAHLEGRLAFLKAELRITDAQTAKWTEFGDSVRAAGKQMLLPCTDAARVGTSPSSLERIETAGKLLSARADALKTVASNGRTLYASLSDEQKTLADDLMFAPVWQ